MGNLDKIIKVMDHPDGGEMFYEYVLRWATELPEDLIFVDIGSYKGGTTMAIMQAVHDSGKRRWVWSIDPYGTKPFRLGTGIQAEAQYDEEIYKSAMSNLSTAAQELNVAQYHWRMTSEDFMKIIEQIDFYDQGKVIKPRFGFVSIDGDHDGEVTEKELQWFLLRMPDGGFILDDVPYIKQRGTPLVKQAVEKGLGDNFRCYIDIKQF